MELPIRSKQHISESASFDLFRSKIPNNWIVREATERDYGIDCYLELVNDNNELTGDLVLIQLKSRQSIDWTASETYTISDVKISTTNYWNLFGVPVFIFLADLDQQEIYMLSVKLWIRKNYTKYSAQKNFSYQFDKKFLFNSTNELINFKIYYSYEANRQQFENELLFFLSNLTYFKEFLSDHSHRDYHFGIESVDQIYFEAMHRNFDFLCDYLFIDFGIPNMNEIKQKSIEKFGDELHYELYEHDIAELVEELELLIEDIMYGLKVFLEIESEYWLIQNPTVYNYLMSIVDDNNLIS